MMFFNNAGFMWNYIQDKDEVSILTPKGFTGSEFNIPNHSGEVTAYGWPNIINLKNQKVPFIQFRIPTGFTGTLASVRDNVDARDNLDEYLSVVPAGMDVKGIKFSYWVIMPANEAPAFIREMPFRSKKERDEELAKLSFYKNINKPTVEKCFALAMMETTRNNSCLFIVGKKKGHTTNNNFNIDTYKKDELKVDLMNCRNVALEILER